MSRIGNPEHTPSELDNGELEAPAGADERDSFLSGKPDRLHSPIHAAVRPPRSREDRVPGIERTEIKGVLGRNPARLYRDTLGVGGIVDSPVGSDVGGPLRFEIPYHENAHRRP